MKKIALSLFILFSISGYAQKLYRKDLLNLEKNIYQEALKNYDLQTAQVAVYHIINLEGNQSKYLDTLAYIYFNQKKFLPCLKVSERILKNRESLPILELKAISLENLKDIKGAIDAYEKIYTQKKEAVVAYKLAQLQQELKRSAEAYATLKSAENLKFPDKGFVAFPTAQKGQSQNVPLKAAFYSLMAQTSYDLHNYPMAVKYYDEALKIYPDFFVAKQNKQVIQMLEKKLDTKVNSQTNQKNK